MRINDWRSDVCSSDLGTRLPAVVGWFGDGHRADVVVLDHEPPAGPQRGGELRYHGLALGHVAEHEPGVDQVVAVGVQWVGVPDRKQVRFRKEGGRKFRSWRRPVDVKKKK